MFNQPILGVALWLSVLFLCPVFGHGQFTTVGSATTAGYNCFEVTSSTFQRGAVWNNTPLNLNNTFDLSFFVWQDHPTNPGSFAGDGMAFVLQTTGNTALGGGGNGLGYGSSQPPSAGNVGINPSLAVELDLWNNSGVGVADLTAHHIGVHANGVITSNIAAANAKPTGATIDDGVCRQFRIRWVPASDSLYVWYNNALRIAIVYNVDGLFANPGSVTWGFTGATGNAPALQRFCYEFADAGPDHEVCSDSTLQLTGQGGGTYNWTDLFGSAPVWLSNNTTATPTASGFAGGSYDLRMVATNSFGCVDRDTVNITVVSKPPDAMAGPDSTFCSADALILYANNSSPGLGSWSTLSGGPPTPSFAQVNNNTTQVNGVSGGPFPVTYDFQWSIGIPGSNACPVTRDTVQITVVQSPTADAGLQDSICSGDTLTLNPNVTGATTYNWTGSPGLFNNTQQNAGFTQVHPQNQFGELVNTVYLTATDAASGCSVTDSVRIRTFPIPITFFADDNFNAYSSNDSTICSKDTIPLFVQADGAGTNWTSITWSPISGLVNYNPGGGNQFASPDSNTVYTIVALDDRNNCQYTDSFSILFPNVDVTGGGDTTICRGDTIQLSVNPGNPGNQILWLPANGGWIDSNSIATPTVAPMDNEVYRVFVSDPTGQCATDEDSVRVFVQYLDVTVTGDPLNQVIWPGEIVINPGQTVDLTSSLNFNLPSTFTYAWTQPDDFDCPDCPNTSVTPAANSWNEGDGNLFTYLLTVTDDSLNGCEATAEVQIRFDTFEAPNVFTPNGDGFNDFLYINYHGPMEYKVWVYDRWGKLTFKTEDRNVNWNGNNLSGKPAPEGVYYMVLEIEGNPALSENLLIPEGKDNDGRNRVYNVTLLR